MRLQWDTTPPKGYVKYETLWHTAEHKYCKWYLYPLYKVGTLTIHAKYQAYRWMNKSGIMKTKQGNVMQLSDIWQRK